MHNMAKGPFPFKGKGENEWRLKTLRARVGQLQTELDAIVKSMYALIDDYDRTFTAKLPAYLVFHKTINGNYVRWRMRGVKQAYFGIANDETGETLLLTLSPAVKRVVLDFEQQRLRVNLLHGLRFYEAKSLEKLISNARRANTLAREA